MRTKKLYTCCIAAFLISGFATTQLVVTAAPAAAQVIPSDTQTDYVESTLSDELANSQWAYVTHRSIAYSEPVSGHAVRRLTTRTPDGTDELVLLLRQRVYNNGSVWVEVRLPMRPANKTGWVRRGSLATFHTVHTHLVIDLNNFKATLHRNNKVIWVSRIGIGKKSLPTPVGNFYVRDQLTTGNPRGVYGPYAFGLSAYSDKLSDWPGGGVVGIHGTNEPGLIPGRISHGCVRVPNNKVRKLHRLLPLGTPVTIS